MIGYPRGTIPLGLPALSHRKKVFFFHIINTLLPKLVRSWLPGIGQYPVVLTSRLVNNLYVLYGSTGGLADSNDQCKHCLGFRFKRTLFNWSSVFLSSQNWFKNKRYRLRLKKGPTNSKMRHLIPAPVQYIENIGPQNTYISVPKGVFYPQCFNSPQGQEEMACLYPPATSSCYFP